MNLFRLGKGKLQTTDYLWSKSDHKMKTPAVRVDIHWNLQQLVCRMAIKILCKVNHSAIVSSHLNIMTALIQYRKWSYGSVIGLQIIYCHVFSMIYWNGLVSWGSKWSECFLSDFWKLHSVRFYSLSAELIARTKNWQK